MTPLSVTVAQEPDEPRTGTMLTLPFVPLQAAATLCVGFFFLFLFFAHIHPEAKKVVCRSETSRSRLAADTGLAPARPSS